MKTQTLFLHLSPLLIPYVSLFCAGVVLAAVQSVGLWSPVPLPSGLGAAYTRLWSSPWFYEMFGFSLYVAFVSALLATGGGTLLACGIWGMPALLRRMSVIYKATLILPHIAIGFIVLVFCSQTGVLASLARLVGMITLPVQFPNILYGGNGFGLILAYTYKEIPFAILMVLGLLAGFDRRLFDCARMLGASRVRIFFCILVPSIAPAMHSAFIILFLYAFGAFDIPYLLGESKPAMLSIEVYNLYFKRDLTNRPLALAMLMLMFCFSVLFIMIYSRVVSSLTARERKL
ncbi:MAG: ABC transporter permease subunit [Desulfoplanes sp.]|nr:ABC transporter permease subunit [Desulfoplanes sp.]